MYEKDVGGEGGSEKGREGGEDGGGNGRGRREEKGRGEEGKGEKMSERIPGWFVT